MSLCRCKLSIQLNCFWSNEAFVSHKTTAIASDPSDDLLNFYELFVENVAVLRARERRREHNGWLGVLSKAALTRMLGRNVQKKIGWKLKPSKTDFSSTFFANTSATEATFVSCSSLLNSEAIKSKTRGKSTTFIVYFLFRAPHSINRSVQNVFF